MIKRLLLGLAVAAVAAVVLTELILPRVIGQMVAQGMKKVVASDQITAQVSKSPSLAMLGGSFDTVDIAASNAKLDKLTFKLLQLELTDVQLDRERLLTHREVSIQQVGGIDFSATLTEEELARYLNQTVKGIRNAQVDITPGQATVTSSFSLGGFANVDITLDGKIVGEGQLIKFVTERLLINNNLIGSIGGNLLTNIPLVDLTKVPFGASVRDIVMTDGLVIINADNRPH